MDRLRNHYFDSHGRFHSVREPIHEILHYKLGRVFGRVTYALKFHRVLPLLVDKFMLFCILPIVHNMSSTDYIARWQLYPVPVAYQGWP
jgi:hypothetical protein